MSTSPMQELAGALRNHGLVRFYEHFAARFADVHLKELTLTAVGRRRAMTTSGRELVNFGFDSFLGLDQHPRVKKAVMRGVRKWGTQFGASRAFASAAVNVEAEEKIACWLGTEAAVLFPSVTLANVGALPGLVTSQDVLVLDQFAHNSMQEGAKIAKANSVRIATFAHNDPADLERVLQSLQPYRCAVLAIDGVYSMSGAVARMVELNEVAKRHHAVLFIDDAHATGVIGEQGRGTVLQALGSYDNTLVVGCLSKACSVFGAFVGCTREMRQLIKMCSSTYIFGGPVPPPYLEGVCEVIDLLQSDEYPKLRGQLDRNIARMAAGLNRLGLVVLGGETPIMTVLIGDEETALRAGKFVFERGYYIQSVTFPAVPYHQGVLRIQINANHRPAAIDGLLSALAELQQTMPLPRIEHTRVKVNFGSDMLAVA